MIICPLQHKRGQWLGEIWAEMDGGTRTLHEMFLSPARLCISLTQLIDTEGSDFLARWAISLGLLQSHHHRSNLLNSLKLSSAQWCRSTRSSMTNRIKQKATRGTGCALSKTAKRGNSAIPRPTQACSSLTLDLAVVLRIAKASNIYPLYPAWLLQGLLGAGYRRLISAEDNYVVCRKALSQEPCLPFRSHHSSSIMFCAGKCFRCRPCEIKNWELCVFRGP